MSGVGQEDLAKEAVEGVTELHGLDGGERQRLLVHLRPAVVDDPAGTAVALGDDSWRRDAKAGEVADLGGREDDPLRLGHHVLELLVEELQMLHARAVRASLEGLVHSLGGPGLRLETDRRSPTLVKLEEALRGMSDVVEARKVSFRAPLQHELPPPQLFQKLAVPLDALG